MKTFPRASARVIVSFALVANLMTVLTAPALAARGRRLDASVTKTGTVTNRSGKGIAISNSRLSLNSLTPFQAPEIVLTVNSTGDEADANVGDSICLTSSGKCTLRAAIKEANGSPANVINFSLPANSIISLNSPLDTIAREVNINGPGANTLTVQRSTASGTPHFRVFSVVNVAVTIAGLTVKNGRAPDGATDGEFGLSGTAGGGIHNNGGKLTLLNTVVTGNRAGDGGQGSATGVGGVGGNGGGVVSSGHLFLINSVVTGNRAGDGGAGGTGNDGGWGGGILGGGAQTVIINSTISNNTAGKGGTGVHPGGSSGGRGGRGGGLASGGFLTITGSTINGNHSGRGGDSEVGPGASGGEGGGISTSGPMVLTNSTIISNVTGESGNEGERGGGGGEGGGISGNGNLNIANCTITDNRTTGYFGGDGGGIYAFGTPINLRNTIVANNSVATGGAEDGKGPDLFGQFNSQDYNLIENTSGATITGPTSHNIIGLDPLLGPLAANGGPTQTKALLPGSPAINGGDNCITKTDGCPPPSLTTSLPQGVTTDQRGTGFPRLFGTSVDIGAFELQIVVPPSSIQLGASNYGVNEGALQVEVRVDRSRDTTNAASVSYATSDGAGSQDCQITGGSASSNCDYSSRSGTLQFAAGETSKTISIPLLDDALVEGIENFSFTLSNPSGANLGGITTTTISITDNDAPLILILDQAGSPPNQAVALDSVLFLRDPFRVVNLTNFLNRTDDLNTRVIVFVANLQLAPTETSSSVVVNLVDGSGQSYDVQAEDVRPVPLFEFMQVRFRLPNNLTPGAYTVKVKLHGLISSSGTMRIMS